MSTTEDAIQEIRGEVYGKLFHEESELNEGQKSGDWVKIERCGHFVRAYKNVVEVIERVRVKYRNA